MEPEATQELLEYKHKVDLEMVRRYRIDWDDACGDLWRLEDALKDGISPEDFVAWIGNKYDLTDQREWRPTFTTLNAIRRSTT